ncbi:MAG: hypothetical protein U0X87_11230 [Anaerolineales bacterium]
MRNGIAPIRRVEKQHARLAVVMRLFDDLIEQLTRCTFLYVWIVIPAASTCSGVTA